MGNHPDADHTLRPFDCECSRGNVTDRGNHLTVPLETSMTADSISHSQAATRTPGDLNERGGLNPRLGVFVRGRQRSRHSFSHELRRSAKIVSGQDRRRLLP